MTDFQKRYLAEVGRRLHCQGFEVWPEYEGSLPIEKDAHRVCKVNVHGSVRYDPDYVRSNGQEDALEQVRLTAAETMTYMRQMAAAPPLLAEGLSGDYRLLAEFNDTVLAGHQTQYGLEFITWSRAHDRSLEQGHYYDTFHGADAYTAAKQDFAVRSGLLPASRFFTQEQLAVIYDAAQNMTVQGHISNPEQEKLLGQIMEQIEDAVPQVIDLANELTQYPKEQEPGGMRMR